jgi:hypothetical protein
MGENRISILKRIELLMSKEQDLDNAVSALATGFAALDTAVHAELAALTTALEGDDTDAVEQAVANISAITSKMAGDAAQLTASIPAATTVPAPAAPTPPNDTPPTVASPTIAPVTVTDPSATPATAAD